MLLQFDPGEFRESLRREHPLPTGDAIAVPITSILSGSSGLIGCGSNDARFWKELYFQILKGSLADTLLPMETLDAIAHYHALRNEVPIVAAHFCYDRLEPRSAIDADLRPSFTTCDDFTGGALLPEQHHYFHEVEPCLVIGREYNLVFSDELWFSNAGTHCERLELMFHDRGVALIPGVKVPISFDKVGRKIFTLNATINGRQRSCKFALSIFLDAAPHPNETWVNLSSTSFQDETATGHAWVYYGWNGDTQHTQITNPLIMSEGFPGNYSLDYLWWSVNENADGLARKLLDLGWDLIILGYDVGTTYIEANAGVVQAVIERVVAQQSGNEPLVVGGACMGGVVTRYALANMETNGVDHHTGLYFSIDSPHMGINCPASIQYALHLGRDFSSQVYSAYLKLTQPAAVELMLYEVDWDFEQPQSPSSARSTFVSNLSSVGNFPSRCRKIGIADGMANGDGNGLPSGINVMASSDSLSLYSAPGGGDDNVMFATSIYGIPWTNYWMDCPFRIDGAPGSTEEYFQAVSQAVKQPLSNSNYGTCCFVPTLSALAMTQLDIYDNASLYENIIASGASSALDVFYPNTDNVNSSNYPHMHVDSAMVSWLLSQLPSLAVRHQRS